jgi:hypothetical protein
MAAANTNERSPLVHQVEYIHTTRVPDIAVTSTSNDQAPTRSSSSSSAKTAVGAKTIGWFASFAFTMNNIAGPGMLDFPAAFQSAGYVPCIACLVVVAPIASICGTLLVDTMARIKYPVDNSNFDARVEFSDIFKYFLGQRWFTLTQLAFYLCLLSQNVAAIVGTAQVLDSLVATALPGGKTYALEVGTAELYDRGEGYDGSGGGGEGDGGGVAESVVFELGPLGRVIDWSAARDCPLAERPGYHHHRHDHVHRHNEHHDYYTTVCAPFTYGSGHDSEEPSQPAAVLTLGYVLCAALFFHLGLANLEENMFMQIASFVALVVIAGEFLWQFSDLAWPHDDDDGAAAAAAVESSLLSAPSAEGEGEDSDYSSLSSSSASSSRVPAFGPDWSSCLGVVIFNFNFAVTLPSWVNEKEEGVGVNAVVWGASAASTLLYAAVGWLGGLAFADIPDNMLELLASPAAVGPVTRVCSLLFGVAIIGLGIPIFCVLMRYNLVVGGVCGNGLGTFLGGVLPWLVSWLVYQGHAVMDLLTWAGLVLNGFIDFLCPVVVALVAVRATGADAALAGLEARFRTSLGDGPQRLSWSRRTKSWEQSSGGSRSNLDDGGGGGGGDDDDDDSFVLDPAHTTDEEGGEAGNGNGELGGGGAREGGGRRRRGRGTATLYSDDVVQPTVVRAVPVCAQWQHELFVIALGAAILTLLSVGLLLKADPGLLT